LITSKQYKCTQCGYVEAQNTNHYENTWSVGEWNCCPKCPPYKKYAMYGGQTIWECIEQGGENGTEITSEPMLRLN
jgi:hypothetical protein